MCYLLNFTLLDESVNWEIFHSRSQLIGRVVELKKNPEVACICFGVFHFGTWSALEETT